MDLLLLHLATPPHSAWHCCFSTRPCCCSTRLPFHLALLRPRLELLLLHLALLLLHSALPLFHLALPRLLIVRGRATAHFEHGADYGGSVGVEESTVLAA